MTAVQPLSGNQIVPEPEPRPLNLVEWARWVWRTLTSMRTALFLLFLLALGSIPGSVIPQASVDPIRTNQWQANHRSLTPVFRDLELFSVYHSVWFSAIYLLLMISLVGCVVPRLGVYWRSMRARPPRAPRHLSRLPGYHRFSINATPDVVLGTAAQILRGRRYRVDVGEQAVAAERGYLREAGNLLFHSSVLIVLVAFAYGRLFGFSGAVIIVTGDTFSDSASAYNDFQPGSLFDPNALPPFALTVNNFTVHFESTGPQIGQPTYFGANVTYRTSPTAAPRTYLLQVNHPLNIDGVDVFLIGQGYAPVVTVRDGHGDVVFSGAVPFLPENGSYRSQGVIKVPDARPSQLGFQGEFLPTYVFTKQTGPITVFPDDDNPVIIMRGYQGDLGLNNGIPQSVNILNTKRLKLFVDPAGKPFPVDLGPGHTLVLPNGAGSMTFDAVRRYVRLQVSRLPAKDLALGGVLLGLLGLVGSLYVRPRRIWVRVGADRDGTATFVEIGALSRGRDANLSTEIETVTARLQRTLEETT